MNPCPPIEGSTYSTWARTERTAKNTAATAKGKSVFFKVTILRFLVLAFGLRKQFLRATFSGLTGQPQVMVEWRIGRPNSMRP
jgi:hypothetical protein